MSENKKTKIPRSTSKSADDIHLKIIGRLISEERDVSPRHLNAIFIDSDRIKGLMSREYILSPRTKETLMKQG